MEPYNSENVNDHDVPTTGGRAAVADMGGFADVPLLDFDSSTIASSSNPTIPPSPQASLEQSLNPQPNSLTYDDLAFLNSLPILYNGEVPMLDQANGYSGLTTNDDIKWMLLGLSSRLDTLEAAVTAGNTQMDQLGSRIIGSLHRLTSAEDFLRAIDDLKQSMKGFARALLTQVFGGQNAGDVDMQGQ